MSTESDEEIKYVTYFKCKYCKRCYDYAKDFVAHKKLEHEPEIIRDCGYKPPSAAHSVAGSSKQAGKLKPTPTVVRKILSNKQADKNKPTPTIARRKPNSSSGEILAPESHGNEGKIAKRKLNKKKLQALFDEKLEAGAELSRKLGKQYVTKSKVEDGTTWQYTCDFCSNVFTDLRNAVHCVCSHTGDELYSCVSCDRTFNLRGNFVIHMRKHTGVKPFTCSICNISFVSNIRLKNHQQGHSSSSRHTACCGKCGRWFIHESTREAHESLCDN